MLRALTLALLSAVLAVTSVTMAVARGQTGPAGQIVLCSGQGLVTIPIDAQGRPTGKPHICPDCALGLITALDAPATVLSTPGSRRDLRLRPSTSEPASLPLPEAPRARGPPGAA